MNIPEKQIPKYGFKVKLNHVYPERWTQSVSLKLRQVLPLIPLALRYLIYYIKILWQGRPVLMDYIHMPVGKQIYGVPLGGIGCGTIGRGFRGEFCRFQLKPGLYEYNVVTANQFIVTIKDETQKTIFQSVLSTYEKPSSKLSSWKWLIDGSKCSYTGLYPRSWTEYDLSEYGVKLVCRQISPVIPHNYKDSSLPCGVFVWDIENISNEVRTVTITFSFKNGTGDKKEDKAVPSSSKSFSYENADGLVLNQTIKTMPCTYALAVKTKSDVEVTKCLYFDPNLDGQVPWSELEKNGRFTKVPELKSSHNCDEMACAIAAQTTVSPSETKCVEMCLVWDMPVVNFFRKLRKYKRYYTKHFGLESASIKIASYALQNYPKWETQIYNWQKDVLNDEELPEWYKSALFNETYFVSDGGGIWFVNENDKVKKNPDDPRCKYGSFAYLEGHEYRMYNTYDVHFYASFALAMNWPYLQVSLQYDMRDAIFAEITETEKSLYDGYLHERKIINTVPHDLGDPGEEPFLLLNSYPIHDVSEWRDLNLKFVLQVFRDYKLLENVEGCDKLRYIQDMYTACKIVMDHSVTFDQDNDGLIENGGFPDQTYDSWVMAGPSAYCGGLWLAALYSMTILSDILKKNEDKKYFSDLLQKGREAFEKKLWTGKFYKFDANHANVIMADQLCGHWYLRCSGCNYEVFPKTNVRNALQTIFDHNVKKFANCERGAVNGFILNGGIDTTTIQSEEVWTGVTYALAASMIHEGFIAEAWKTAGGMYNCVTGLIGMGFETPEAIHAGKWYRAIGYMRPLSIWSMQLAWKQHKQQLVETR